MDYKKLYLEYKQKYLMSQKYLMGGTVTPSLASTFESLTRTLNTTSYEYFDNSQEIHKMNGRGAGVTPLFDGHKKDLNLKYTFINNTTLEELAKSDTYLNKLKDIGHNIHEKKLFVISYTM